MRVLVTGGAGFIGGYACAELARRGHEPLVLDRHRWSSCEWPVMLGDVRDEVVRRAPLGGTAAENATKTACPAGHPYDPDHARITARGRVCRICDNEASRRYRARKKARL